LAHLLEIVIQNEAPPPFYVLCQENITPAPFSGDPYGDVCQTKHTATKIHNPWVTKRQQPFVSGYQLDQYERFADLPS